MQNTSRPTLHVHPDPDALGVHLAGALLDRLATTDGLFLLGCPGGRSLRETYRALGRLAAEREADLSRMVIVMMDDYLLPEGDGFVACPADAHYSCARFAEGEIRMVINCDLPQEHRIPPSQVWLPDPRCPENYDRRIAEAGGIACFLLASGASDGHVAFNPPGTPVDSRTRVIPLAETTRRDNLGTFPDFADLDAVPRYGISVGLGTIAGQSASVAMVIHGTHKRSACEAVLGRDDFDSAWPASIVYRCRLAEIHCDRAACPEEHT